VIELLADLDREVARTEELVGRYSDQWTRREELSSLYQRRARLRGAFEDWVRADDSMEAAFRIAPPPSGPQLGAARLDLALHRLDAVEPHLASHEARVIVDQPSRAEVARLRADVALQRGDHARARAGYEESLGLRTSLAATYGLVQLAWWEGRFDEALAGLDRCEDLVVGRDEQTRAWLDLQRGLIALDRGRWEEAERRYVDADAHVPGWYLVAEHLAEVHLLLGRVDEAEAGWRAVIASTGGAPEFLDALAASLRERGVFAEAEALSARADAAWRDMLEHHPEAATGHALDHFIQSDPALALQLARADATRRPNGGVRTRLAEAQFAAGDAAAARSEVGAVLGTPYRSAALFTVGAAAARALGDTALADAWFASARAIDPHAVEP
jgi:Tfp pilus assembly protein PilF